MSESVNHPAHYGGAENPYEAIKVIDAWGLGFCLGNAVGEMIATTFPRTWELFSREVSA